MKLRHVRTFLSAVILAVCLWIPGTAAAFGPEAPAPVIEPEEANGKQVLFDNSHGQTAGQADWVIDGAFSDFAEGIADRGYYVEELRQITPIQVDDLEAYDVFIIPEANIPFQKEEQEALIEYTENGGSIFFISDHYNADRNKNRWDSSEIMNGYRRGAYSNPTKGMDDDEKAAMEGVESSDWLADHFGIRFRYNAPGTITADEIVSPDETFGITEGVNEVAVHAGSTLAITNPEQAKGIVYLPENLNESDKWGPAVDEGIYFGGGEEEGPYAAISKLQAGKAAFIGDSSPVEDATPKYRNEETGDSKTTYDGFQEADDSVLLLNMVDWLAEEESYESFSEKDIPLDNVSPLLDKETPKQSTEPEKEPWSEPAANYEWYNPDTFASGSYGSYEEAEKDPSYQFQHQDPLPNNESFTLELIIEGLESGETVTGYNAGMYLDGGEQIAQVQNEDGSWPSSYGYSEKFSVTADEEGIAVKELTVRVKEGTEGPANLRLRQGGSNLYTTTVTLAEETSDNPEEEPQFMTIAEARQQTEGTTVQVEGVITSTPGIFGAQGFYVQDDTGGIYIYQHDSGFEKGEHVTITGSTASFQNQIELTDIESIEKNGSTELPPYHVVNDVNDQNQGERVEIASGTIKNVESYYNAFEFDIDKNDKATRVRVDNRTGISLESFQSQFQEGDLVTIAGIASIYQDTYQLMLLNLEDIKKETHPPVIQDIDFSTFDITKEYSVPITVTDKDNDIAEVTAFLNDETWEDQIKISPLLVTPGEYEINVKAADEEGNSTERTFTVEAVLDLSQLDDLIEKGNQQGFIKNDKVAERLLKKAENVQQAKNEPSRQGKWNALQHQMKAQSGKKIEEEYLQYWQYPQ
ncbi:endonuclease [Alteribacillus bidgolensis]|uniref:Endonuclease n=1 Tax=Alteribacillus bidgolensis TaxID=930129 RepID=A0A1G8HJU8_9BACI|nr:endonuclease [Alteribacillus bidgolensis]SDI06924.1 hypothetical protein SAMN05216352_104293 [Alteribacillus bidgolensis]